MLVTTCGAPRGSPEGQPPPLPEAPSNSSSALRRNPHLASSGRVRPLHPDPGPSPRTPQGPPALSALLWVRLCLGLCPDDAALGTVAAPPYAWEAGTPRASCPRAARLPQGSVPAGGGSQAHRAPVSPAQPHPGPHCPLRPGWSPPVLHLREDGRAFLPPKPGLPGGISKGRVDNCRTALQLDPCPLCPRRRAAPASKSGPRLC